MSGDAEWGPWIEHEGKGLPVPVGSRVFVEQADGAQGVLTVEEPKPKNEGGDAFIWDSLRPGRAWVAIIRYRVRKPRALLDLIDLVENLPAPTRQPSEVAP